MSSYRGGSVLTLWSVRTESLWVEALTIEVRELPEGLSAPDRLLSDREFFAPTAAHWRPELEKTRRAVLTDGRRTIARETYVG